MKARTFLIIGACALLLCPIVNAGGPTASRGAEPQHDFILDINPVTGTVNQITLQHAAGDTPINEEFLFVDAVCTDCNGCPGPDMNRHIQVRVQSVNGVAATGIGAGRVRTTRSTLFAVSPPEKNPIAVDQVVQLDFEVQLLTCGPTFKLRFDMCNPAPPVATDSCEDPV